MLIASRFALFAHSMLFLYFEIDRVSLDVRLAPMQLRYRVQKIELYKMELYFFCLLSDMIQFFLLIKKVLYYLWSFRQRRVGALSLFQSDPFPPVSGDVR